MVHFLKKIADRFVQGLGVQPGELIDLRDGAGDFDFLLETSLAIERAGATALVQHHHATYLERLWAEVDPQYLERWDRHRQEWIQQVDRVLFLGGAQPDHSLAPRESIDAWQRAIHRLTVTEEERRLPFLLAAVPTERGAQQLGMTLEQMRALLLPALGASVEELKVEITRVRAKVESCRKIAITSGEDHVLHLEHGEHSWLSDDGLIDAADRERGAIVSNLPAGSLYTTVLEDRTHGSLYLPRAGEAGEVIFHFREGRIVEIEAASGAEKLASMFDRHSGEPRRVSHIGIGLNPYLSTPTGWILIDEHIHGALFFALGENRYMGGQNESSLNVDYLLPQVTLAVDGQVIVAEGEIIA